MILTILRFTAFDAAGARSTPQFGAKAHPMEPMPPFRFVRSLQNHPLGDKYAAR